MSITEMLARSAATTSQVKARQARMDAGVASLRARGLI